jgi:hypothetical protein
MGFEANDHVILHAEFGRVVGRFRFADPLLAFDQEFQTAFLDRCEMRTAGDER